MGLFGQSSPFDAEVEKATSETNTSEPWGVIMDICDKVGSNPRNAKDCLKAIMKRMGHADPHIAIQAITLLDACVNNCGKNFHLEIASREFENEFKRLLSKSQKDVALKMRLLLKRWAENDFKSDPQLNLIPSLYQKLKSEGQDFTENNQKTSKSSTPASVLKDPNVVTSQQEEEDIAKAIELSLKETKSSPKKQQTATSTYPSLYPSFSGGAASAGASSLSAPPPVQEPRKVRALYDFEAAEDNELTFTAGDIIHVLDDSDPNWWKGYNEQGEGLFPSNFVTADLSVEPERLDINQKNKKTVQFEDESKDTEKTDVSDKLDDDKSFVPEINEEKIDRLLHLLHEANPEDPSQDSEEMLRLEEQVNKMGPLIDAELERVDRKHAQLTKLSSDLVDAINLYHTLMREPDRANMPIVGNQYFPGFNPPQNVFGPGNTYGIQNVYNPNSRPPTSMPTISTIHSLSGVQQGPQSAGPHPSQIMVVPGNSGSNFPAHMIPIQFQNGHPTPPPTSFPSNQQQPLPQQQQQPSHIQYQLSNQPQSQSPQSLQQLHSILTAINHPVTSQAQQQQLQPNSQPSTQHQPPNTQVNPSFLPPPASSIPGMFSVPTQGLNVLANLPNNMMPPAGPYQPLSQQPPNMANGVMGPALGNQPLQQQLPFNNAGPLSLPSHPQHHQLSAINQPVTQTILGQNDSKTVIPIHQQQR